ncbi:MAG TPA: molybdopterin-dependent oxidoreductase [Bryobacteraceae bacterium]|nr:molybdopterin-dependent oxidoreductase [Bryobacteraceae bacterium]
MPEIRHSVCALDCPDACAVLVSIDDAGKATRLRGDPAHPVTRGFLCGKVARYLEREYAPSRLLYPMRRAGAKGEGRFTRVAWDEALDEIAARLKSIATEFGPEAILPYSYAGTMGLLNGSGMDRRFFHRLGASRLDRTICSSAGGAGLIDALGFKYGTEPEQFRHSRLIIAWGANVLGTNVHLWPFIVEARRNGARFYTIDPRRNRTGAAADKHFFINPGSDTALALGMMHVIIGEKLYDADYIAGHTTGLAELAGRVQEYPPERAAALTGIPKDEIVALAREYATTRPAAIRLNYGVQRSDRGAMAVRTVALLPALTGSWKEVGGGLQVSTSQAFHLNRAGLERADLQWRALGREARIVNMSSLGQILNHAPNGALNGALNDAGDPPVKALVVYNSNPAAIAPNQNAVRRGLQRADLFTVVLEQFQTDTADCADFVLPATTFLEHTDLYLAYGHYYLQLARPALAPPGETRSNVEVFRALAQRMGFDDACFGDSDDDMIRTLLDSEHPFVRGITLEELERDQFVRLRVAPNGDPFLPFSNGGFGTPSGKCEFHAESIEYTPPVESRFGDESLRARFPLELISPKHDDSMNSTFGNRPENDAATATVHIEAADAAARGITTGDQVRVFNDRGACLLRAQLDGVVRRGVVCVPSVRWASMAADGHSVNALTSERLTDKGGGPTFFSCLVQVEKSGD